MGSIPEFTARTESRNGVARIAVDGELDMTTVPVLLEQLTRFEQDGVSAIMLDLRDVSFVDSTGLHAFLEAHDRAKTNGHRFVLSGATPFTRRLFAITGTEFLLDRHEAASVLGQFTGRGRPLGPTEFAVTNGDD
jgi:anti-sigma B factor antagonist